MTGPAPFLTAAWRHLALLNYEVDPALLAPHVPPGTELDTWHGHALVSLVGFRFLGTRVRGFAIPGYQDFDEVNLRCYVRRLVGDGEWRRGVVFLKEIVPKRLIAAVARLRYGEPYVRLPMRHELEPAGAGAGAFSVRYAWKHRGHWQAIAGRAHGQPAVFAPGSEEEFITEHYWGYTARRRGPTAEYRVTHPRWRVWPLAHARLEGDVSRLYGSAVAAHLGVAPRSAFLADGSDVAVYPARRLTPDDLAWAAA